MTAVQAPRRPAYRPFHTTVEALGVFSQRLHSRARITCGLMTPLSILGRSAITQAPSLVSGHFARHNSSGTLAFAAAPASHHPPRRSRPAIAHTSARVHRHPYISTPHLTGMQRISTAFSRMDTGGFRNDKNEDVHIVAARTDSGVTSAFYTGETHVMATRSRMNTGNLEGVFGRSVRAYRFGSASRARYLGLINPSSMARSGHLR
jgi:hypothetical protein